MELKFLKVFENMDRSIQYNQMLKNNFYRSEKIKTKSARKKNLPCNAWHILTKMKKTLINVKEILRFLDQNLYEKLMFS